MVAEGQESTLLAAANVGACYMLPAMKGDVGRSAHAAATCTLLQGVLVRRQLLGVVLLGLVFLGHMGSNWAHGLHRMQVRTFPRVGTSHVKLESAGGPACCCAALMRHINGYVIRQGMFAAAVDAPIARLTALLLLFVLGA